MRKTTLSRSLLLTAALALGATTATAQTPTYNANAPVVNVAELTDGNYVLNIHNTSGQDVPGINATGLVYYDQRTPATSAATAPFMISASKTGLSPTTATSGHSTGTTNTRPSPCKMQVSPTSISHCRPTRTTEDGAT